MKPISHTPRTVTCFVQVAVSPASSVIVKTTLYVPASAYVWFTTCPDPVAVLSPKFQDQETIELPLSSVSVLVDPSRVAVKEPVGTLAVNAQVGAVPANTTLTVAV